MNPTIKQNLSNTTIWFRLLFMVFFGVVLWLMLWVAGLIVLFQFLTALFTGQPNGNLHGINRSVARYVEHIFQYLLFCTDKRPFPFSAWPPVTTETATETKEASTDAASESDVPAAGTESSTDSGAISKNP